MTPVVVGSAVVGSGFIGVPLWYCRVGRLLLRSPARAPHFLPTVLVSAVAHGRCDRLTRTAAGRSKPVRG